MISIGCEGLLPVGPVERNLLGVVAAQDTVQGGNCLRVGCPEPAW